MALIPGKRQASVAIASGSKTTVRRDMLRGMAAYFGTSKMRVQKNKIQPRLIEAVRIVRRNINPIPHAAKIVPKTQASQGTGGRKGRTGMALNRELGGWEDRKMTSCAPTKVS